MKRLLQSKHLPLAATLLVLVILFAVASIKYEGFFSWRVISILLGDNAFLGITAIGMTFVILSGGIDLSVGAVLAFTTIFIATMIGQKGAHPLAVIPMALGLGAGFGAGMGFLIMRYALPPFLVTLGGMFLARGMAFVVNQESLGINHPLYQRAFAWGVPLNDRVSLPATGVIFIVVVFLAVVIAHYTRFGRNIYAIGGNESSAVLMGLPVGRTKVLVYAVSGGCAALGGVVATFYMGSGNPAMGFGLELDAIASVVIGGTLLSGGVGTIAGTLAGVLIFATIQTALMFDGRLNSWWLRIVIGMLLLLFILLQRLLTGVKR